MTNTNPRFSILAMSFAGGPRPRNAALIIGGLWLILFFGALFAPPLLDDADATHAQAARAMAITGDLVTLRVDGIRYLEKAPLPYWLVAASFRLFGFNTFATHLPQALAVLLLALLGHRWANQAFGARTGFYTAVSVLTSAGVFLFTRVFIPEVWLSLFLAAALFAFLKSLHPVLQTGPAIVDASVTANERPAIAWYAGPRFYPYVMWGSLALAVLSKGLVALVFFFGTAAVYLSLTDDLRRWRALRPFSGSLLFLLIAAPWHILAGLRNTGGAQGHGFLWFYFINEHFLRFLGKRQPMDYNKLPGYLFWSLHLVWLFPWALFLPLALGAVSRRSDHQRKVLTVSLAWSRWSEVVLIAVAAGIGTVAAGRNGLLEAGILAAIVWNALEISLRRRAVGLTLSPFHRIDAQQRSILLLSIFAGLILFFFSLSTNQEYYTFPAYLPILLLTSATITRAEQTYSKNPGGRRWLTVAHASLMIVGMGVALALCYGLWTARHLPFVPDIGDLLAHRGVGDYTLSMSHLFDLTGESFAALRLPATLAALTFAFGPAAAWALRRQRRHMAATTAVALTSAAFLFAAHIALIRFGPMLSSEDLAEKIEELQDDRLAACDSEVMLFGDQAYGSSLPFYLGRQVYLVDGRSSSMLFGSTFPDAPRVFLTGGQLSAQWGTGPRKLLFVPLEKRDEADRLLGSRQILLEETSGKALVTDRKLDDPQSRPTPGTEKLQASLCH